LFLSSSPALWRTCRQQQHEQIPQALKLIHINSTEATAACLYPKSSVAPHIRWPQFTWQQLLTNLVMLLLPLCLHLLPVPQQLALYVTTSTTQMLSRALWQLLLLLLLLHTSIGRLSPFEKMNER
jgi:hypothetical protein